MRGCHELGITRRRGSTLVAYTRRILGLTGRERRSVPGGDMKKDGAHRVLLTGAGGFVGSHVLRHLLVNTNWEIVCPVTFRHKGNGDRIASSIEDRPGWKSRVQVVICDLAAPISTTTANRFGSIDAILNVASESHVDRSIVEPVPFIRNNVDLMINLLEYARLIKPKVFVHMSTDEVYGPAAEEDHAEWATLLPSNPYSASKAAQESIAVAYWRTYGVPLIVTNCMNIIGQMQDPEKYAMLIMRRLLDGKPVPVHVSETGEYGSRFYIHARNFADAWLHLLTTTSPTQYGESDRPDKFHISGDREIDNYEFALLIAACMGIGDPAIETVNFHSSRPGHDLRYALDDAKLKATGWTPPVSFEDSLRATVQWTLENPAWLDISA